MGQEAGGRRAGRLRVRFVRFGSLMVVGNHRLLSGGGARWFFDREHFFYPHPHPHPHRTLNLSSGADVYFIFFEILGGFLIFFIL